MDFHQAFEAIDEDQSGTITVDELNEYCRKMNYKESFVTKWLTLFDVDQSGTIEYEEYCQTLGLIPKEEVVKKAKEFQLQQAVTVKAGHHHHHHHHHHHKKTVTTTTTSVKVEKVKGQKRAGPRNSVLSGILMKYSRARMFEKRAAYRMKKRGDGLEKKMMPKEGSAKAAPATKTKQIGGEKNGKTRQVPVTRPPRAYDTQQMKRKNLLRKKSCFKDHVRKLRPGLVPGTVCILLAGKHRGKRVVLLKQLPDTGLLLVTGPYKLNGVPLRRVNQNLVIATKTRLRISKLKLPERLTDKYFQREKQLKKAKAGDDGDIFKQEKKVYEVNAERKEDQKSVDGALIALIKSRDDKKLLLGYLSSQFSVKSGDKVHQMRF